MGDREKRMAELRRQGKMIEAHVTSIRQKNREVELLLKKLIQTARLYNHGIDPAEISAVTNGSPLSSTVVVTLSDGSKHTVPSNCFA